MKINKRLLMVGNIAAFFATLTVNYLANVIPIGGNTTGALSDSYPNLFVPAGITFSIWGAIYLFLLCFIAYQARYLFSKQQKDDAINSKIGVFFILSSLANIGWIFTWHYKLIWLSLLFMFAIFGTLLVIYLRLGAGKNKPALLEKLFVHIPFSIYLGWITVAIIANISALLISLGWDGFGLPENVWAIVMICAACLITLLVLLTRKDIAYALVIIWAFAGIIIKRTNPAFQPQQGIVIASWICIGLVGLGVIISGIKMIAAQQKG